MNSPTESESSPIAQSPPWDGNPSPGSGNAEPANWLEAILSLIAARVALIQLESQIAAKQGARKAAKVAIAAAFLFFGWLLVLAGTVAAVAHTTGWAWHWVAISLAALHFLAAFWLAHSAKAPLPPTFTATREEFQKDREWIENLKHPRKSNV
jgi:uncharacterized membrane protein YqjE